MLEIQNNGTSESAILTCGPAVWRPELRGDCLETRNCSTCAACAGLGLQSCRVGAAIAAHITHVTRDNKVRGEDALHIFRSHFKYLHKSLLSRICTLT